jgi:peptidoglycan/LPS O-acetylase OafA/YrhL
LADRDGVAAGFRTDINGLRAVSIVLVVAYHLAARFAPGGFVGVDVFFVISGFLMTQIIVGRLGEGRFKLWEFYRSRLKRIWPALVVLCLVLWIVGATLLDPWTFERLSGDIPSVLGFLSNNVFAGRRGYFAPDEAANWLLHTWSLSVEWQFYLAYPLLLLALFATPVLKRWVWLVIAILAAGSFALALLLSFRGQSWAFYLLPTRTWELLAGALCAAPTVATLSGSQRGLLHAAGLVLIGVGAWVAVPSAGWPSAVALLPVGGAVLVIAGGLKRTYWAENAAVSALGRASYSIYLWHWPLIVALRYAAIPITPPVALATVAATLGLGFASYLLVERAATEWLFAPRSSRWRLGLAGAAIVSMLAVWAGRTEGLEAFRTADDPPAVRAALAEDRAASADWTYPRVCGRFVSQRILKICSLGDPAARQVLVIGDSHAEQIAPRYAHAFDGRAGEGLTLLTAGCIPIPGVGVRYQGGGCAKWTTTVYDLAERAGFRRVVILSAWTVYFRPAPGAPMGITCLATAQDCETTPPPPTLAGLADAEFGRLSAEVARLRRRGIEVVLIAPAPRGEAADPYWLYHRQFQTHDASAPPLLRADVERDAGLERGELAKVHLATGAPLVDPLDALCPDGLCPVMEGGRDLYMDRWHFRASAVGGPRFAYLDPWLGPDASPTRLK